MSNNKLQVFAKLRLSRIIFPMLTALFMLTLSCPVNADADICYLATAMECRYLRFLKNAANYNASNVSAMEHCIEESPPNTPFAPWVECWKRESVLLSLSYGNPATDLDDILFSYLISLAKQHDKGQFSSDKFFDEGDRIANAIDTEFARRAKVIIQQINQRRVVANEEHRILAEKARWDALSQFLNSMSRRNNQNPPAGSNLAGTYTIQPFGAGTLVTGPDGKTTTTMPFGNGFIINRPGQAPFTCQRFGPSLTCN